MTNAPISSSLLKQIDALDLAQKHWLAGYCWAAAPLAPQPEKSPPNNTENIGKPTILAASQTGNAWRTAKALSRRLKEQQIDHRLIRASGYSPEELAQESTLLLVLATYGSGQAPEEGEAFSDFLSADNAPVLSHLSYAVLGLGDSSFTDFCGFAEHIDQRLAEQGATALLPLQKCDVDFQADSETWINSVASLLANTASNQQTNTPTDDEPIFFSGSLKEKKNLSHPLAEKNTVHLTLQVDDARFHYQPGDALAIYCHNDETMIEEMLHYCQLSGEEIPSKQHSPLRNLLREQYDITRNHPALLQRYAQLSGSSALEALCHDTEKLQQYLHQTPVIGLMSEHPCAMSADEMLSLFRPLQPRYYSVASSAKQQANQVELTVGIQHFQHHGKTYNGSASGYLGHSLTIGEKVRFFIAENPTFRLPENPDTPIIMIAAGTGIAPFRAFLQERTANRAQGKNWLIFGNRRPNEDFYYQQEWQQYQDNGLLTRFDFVASRAQAQKEYVHHRLIQHAEALWQWLEDGAIVYLCGNAERLTNSVENAIVQIISQQKQVDEQEAKQLFTQLKSQKRYLKDVY